VTTVLDEHYDVVGLLGEGGMCRVFEVRPRDGGPPAALKVLRTDRTDEIHARRFLREAAAAVRLHHPNVLPVLATGTWQGGPAMVMELVRGGTLRPFVARRPGLPAAAEQLAAVADALVHAHELGLVHRDLKPENVLVADDGRPLVADWGLARTAADESRVTATGMLVGTPVYMAPEQIVGRAPTTAADCYALGVMAYETVAGRPPFCGDDVAVVLQGHLSRTPPALRGFDPLVPGTAVRLIGELLDKNPAKRPSAAEAARRFRDLGAADEATSRTNAAVRTAPSSPGSATAFVPSPGTSTPTVGATALGPPPRPSSGSADLAPPEAESGSGQTASERRRFPGGFRRMAAAVVVVLAIVGTRMAERTEWFAARHPDGPADHGRAGDLVERVALRSPVELDIIVKPSLVGPLEVSFDPSDGGPNGALPRSRRVDPTIGEALPDGRRAVTVPLDPPLLTKAQAVVAGRPHPVDGRAWLDDFLAPVTRLTEVQVAELVRRCCELQRTSPAATRWDGLRGDLAAAGLDGPVLERLASGLPEIMGEPEYLSSELALRVSNLWYLEAVAGEPDQPPPPWGAALRMLGVTIERNAFKDLRRPDVAAGRIVLAERRWTTDDDDDGVPVGSPAFLQLAAVEGGPLGAVTEALAADDARKRRAAVATLRDTFDCTPHRPWPPQRPRLVVGVSHVERTMLLHVRLNDMACTVVNVGYLSRARADVRYHTMWRVAIDLPPPVVLRRDNRFELTVTEMPGCKASECARVKALQLTADGR